MNDTTNVTEQPWWRHLKYMQIIRGLAKRLNVKRIAEIGVWKGALFRWVLSDEDSPIEEYWAVDPYHDLGTGYGRMSELSSGDWHRIYKRNCSDMLRFKPLKLLRMTSVEASNLFPKEHFDLVFIDAVHEYDACKEDINAWMPLVRKGGIISGHDYNSRRKEHAGVTVAVNEIFGAENIQKYDGMIWAYEIN